MNYEDMSDFEINKLVVELKCKGQLIKILPQKDAFDPIETGVMSSDVHIITRSDREQSINPCNNPSDAWPIIVESEISIVADGDGYYAIPPISHFAAGGRSGRFDFDSDYAIFWYEPLRAAMICFLKMKDAGL